MHYFAEKLAGNRCDSFVGMARGGDGRVLEYGWEVMDAFLDDMKEEDPDLLILSGDLTLDGEKASHEELAELLEGLSEAGIEVAVIPGNHDINNPDARRYTADGTERWSPSQRTSSGISMLIWLCSGGQPGSGIAELSL